MSRRSLHSRLSSVGMSLVLLACSFPATWAQGGSSVYQKLGEYENVLFGKADTSSPIEKRLQNVEKQLFGKASKGGSTSERIEAVEKVMKGSKYLPPIAPEMDRSDFAPEPKKAPENPDLSSKEIEDARDAPLPADAGDRTKGLLRQAMQSYSQGKTADAERLYQQVLAIDFRNSDANYNLGAIAETKGDLNAAKHYYTAALKASPGDYDISDALKAVQQKLKTQAATSAAAAPQPAASGADSTSLEGAPAAAGDKAIASEAADSYKKGNFDDAIQKLAFLARKNPYDANTQFALGQAFRGKGDINNAAKHLRSAAQLDPRNDLYVKALNEIQSQAEDQQASAGAGSASESQPYSSQFSRQGRNGALSGNNDVTPFVGLPSNNNNDSDMAAADSYLRRNGGGNGVMIGSVSGFGSPMGGMGLGMGGMGMGGLGMGGMMLGTGSGGTRLTRMMTGSLGGAAMGAMMGRGQPGGMSRGAMKGALFGLMMGGF